MLKKIRRQYAFKSFDGEGSLKGQSGKFRKTKLFGTAGVYFRDSTHQKIILHTNFNEPISRLCQIFSSKIYFVEFCFADWETVGKSW